MRRFQGVGRVAAPCFRAGCPPPLDSKTVEHSGSVDILNIDVASSLSFSFLLCPPILNLNLERLRHT